MTIALLDNRYQILEKLAQGGFGQTFLAIDTRMPSQRRCVIKQLKPNGETSQAQEQQLQERFKLEAAILEELGEKNDRIPRLYDYFCEAGNFFLVQEWIEGETLRQKQEREGLVSEPEVKRILQEILAVIEYIHSRRIIHRDIKPENIILRSPNSEPVLIDFGAVKEAMNTVMYRSKNNPVSISIGTPGYMPCEQAAGRPVYSSDLYGLGLTALYLLTGKTPQELETDPNTAEILWQKEIQIGDRNLAAAIDKAIRFNHRDRFSSASQMLQALNSSQPNYAPAAREETSSSLNSQAATVAVAPKPKQSVNSTVVTSAAAPPKYAPNAIASPQQEKGIGNFIRVFLLLLGLVGGSFAIGFNLFQPEQRSATDTKPAETSSPVVNIPREEPADTPKPREDLNPITPENPEPITPEDSSANPEPFTEEPNSDPADIPDVIVTSPSEPSPSSPQPTPTPKTEIARGSSLGLPVNIKGSTASEIIAVLGEPSQKRSNRDGKVIYLNYRDYLYNKVDLRYVFNTQTDRVRTIEVFFTPSVGLGEMEKALDDLLDGKVSPRERRALGQVYRNLSNYRYIETGDFKMIIKKRSGDSLRIAIEIQNS